MPVRSWQDRPGWLSQSLPCYQISGDSQSDQGIGSDQGTSEKQHTVIAVAGCQGRREDPGAVEKRQ